MVVTSSALTISVLLVTCVRGLIIEDDDNLTGKVVGL